MFNQFPIFALAHMHIQHLCASSRIHSSLLAFSRRFRRKSLILQELCGTNNSYCSAGTMIIARRYDRRGDDTNSLRNGRITYKSVFLLNGVDELLMAQNITFRHALSFLHT